MCYFEQTRWMCGYWRWGRFRQQCNKEYRIGETCGLKLVYETEYINDVCKNCHEIEKKKRRFEKFAQDAERWRDMENRTASAEKALKDRDDMWEQICKMQNEHDQRVNSLQ